MWTIATVAILTIELILLMSFIVGRLKKQALNETAVFVALVYIVNLALNLVPYLHNVIVLKEPGNPVLEVLECMVTSVRMFIGEADGASAEGFSEVVPLFAYVHLLAVVLSLMTTISAAIEAFGNTIRNYFRREKALKQTVCDIVVGNDPKALQYAKSCNAVLLLDDSVSKEAAVELMEEGYAVLRKNFTAELYKNRQFRSTTRYNVVCLDGKKALDYIDTFIAYQKESEAPKNTYLYVELEEDKAATIRREIIEKNGCEEWITTFCTNELLARTFTEENPVVKYLPKESIDTAAIKPGTQIHVYILGFGKLSQQMYRQSILNNQLVAYENGSYRLLPVQYHICDTDVATDVWAIDGLKKAMGELADGDYVPLPEMPFVTEVLDRTPDSGAVLKAIKNHVQTKDAYTLVIVNTEEDCRNIEIAAKLKTQLFGMNNYHVFARSETAFTEDEAEVTYFGKFNRVLNHNVIVNESLSVMAKKVNEIYTAQYAGEERSRPDFAQYIQKKAEEDWNKLDYFTLYSNIYSAMSLRLKLILLGLDYTADGKKENLSLLDTHYPKTAYSYEKHTEQSVRNALIAQEHARWNAYHLLGEWLPMEKGSITAKPGDGKKVRFNVKNPQAKKHVCLTTYHGLDVLSTYLAEKAGNGATAADYDYYVYDEMLITSAEELLGNLGYSLQER